jgi:hypothetical protein
MQANPEAVEMSCYNSFEQAGFMKDQWDCFVEATCGDIFLTYDWCRVWWKYYGGNKTLKIFVFRCEGKLVGLLPTYIDNIGIGPLAVKVARIVCTTYILSEVVNLPITGEHRRQVIEKWLEHLCSELRPDIVCVGPIYGGIYENADRLVGECAAWRGQRFVMYKKKAGELTMFHLGASMEEYLASLPCKERHETNRHCRNILKILPDKNAGIVFEAVSDSKLHNELDEFIQMHNHQWQRVGQSGHFNDWPHSKEFHHEAAESQLNRGRLRLFKISIGQTCLGYEYAYKFAHTYFHYLNARTSAKEFKRVAVGKVAFCEFVKKAIAENVNLINSMRGRYKYKMRMGGVLEPYHVALICRRGLIPYIRVRILVCFSWLLRICYYKIWFSRIAPKLRLRRKKLWNLWIRTNVFAY